MPDVGSEFHASENIGWMSRVYFLRGNSLNPTEFRKYLTEYESVEPCGVGRSRIENYAEECSLAVGEGGRDDLCPLIESNGGTIHYVPLPVGDPLSGAMFVHADGKWDIVIPQYTSTQQDRFTIAHELGHYLLHVPENGHLIVAARRGEGSGERAEREADWFAAAFLMPKEEFLSSCERNRDSMSCVAVEFDVPKRIAELRYEYLKKAG